ncbi:hypothetical protein [Paenibacillus flagellatus]|uniref:Uncharacterized protein n=1 Tax=Paenibacillus flagellatus TaxID=2211139 RepID=A0A2V5K408_9BACL|nr:hypothetical protein [Paenibacillus flagellatus]PYI54019.1 hypothetical protein DLM86_15860 [Paenibacillus flagellatus]
MDQLTAFLQDRWLVVVVALVVLFVVIKIVKTVVKWVIVLAIVAGLIYYGSTYTDKLKDVATIAKEAVGDLKEKAVQGLAGKDAKFKDNGDGTYTVTSGNIRLDGKAGSDKVKITIAGVSAEFSLDEALKKGIEAAKTNG